MTSQQQFDMNVTFGQQSTFTGRSLWKCFTATNMEDVSFGIAVSNVPNISVHPAHHSFSVFYWSIIVWTTRGVPVRGCSVMNHEEKGGYKAADATRQHLLSDWYPFWKLLYSSWKAKLLECKSEQDHFNKTTVTKGLQIHSQLPKLVLGRLCWHATLTKY